MSEGNKEIARRLREEAIRRRALVSLVLVTLLALFPSNVTGQDRAVRVDSLFSHMAGPYAPGCAVSVVEHGAQVLARGYGMANLEYGVPITPHSVFHVASLSKQFTAMAIELLVNDGLVSWDAASPLFRDAFEVAGATATFSRDTEGQIDGFIISDGRVWGVRFNRTRD